MGFYEACLEKVAAVCVGSAAVILGGAPSGLIEAAVGIAAVGGFVAANRQQFGPECARVRTKIHNGILANYQRLASGGDGSFEVTDLEAASDHLRRSLDICYFDRDLLVSAAITVEGFPQRAASTILAQLGQAHPEFFGEKVVGSLTYRFAKDVVVAGLTAAIEDADYYRQLEPKLMFEMGQAIGSIRDSVEDIKTSVSQLLGAQGAELKLLRERHGAAEYDLIALASLILGRRVPRESVLSVLDDCYDRLDRLRPALRTLNESFGGDSAVALLLAKADNALQPGSNFSLDEAEAALRDAELAQHEITTRLDKEASAARLDQAKILARRADVAQLKLDFQSASSFIEQQIALLLEVSEGSIVALRDAHHSLAIVELNLSRFAEALEQLDEAIKLNKDFKDPDSDDASLAYSSLSGVILDQLGRFKDAESYHLSAIEVAHNKFGVEHHNTLGCLIARGHNLAAQGRNAEAEEILRRVLEICVRVFGDKDERTLTTYNNLGFTLDRLNRPNEAVEMLEKASSIQDSMIGRNHPNSITTRTNLAGCLLRLKRTAEALSLVEDTLNGCIPTLGSGHLFTARLHFYEGLGFAEQSRTNHALEAFQKALAIGERVLGPLHPEVGNSYMEIGSLHMSASRWQQAEIFFGRALNAFVEGAPQTERLAKCLHELGLSIEEQNRSAEAEKQLRKSGDLYGMLFGASDQRTLMSWFNLAIALSNQAKWKEAEELLKKITRLSSKIRDDSLAALVPLLLEKVRRGRKASIRNQ